MACHQIADGVNGRRSAMRFLHDMACRLGCLVERRVAPLCLPPWEVKSVNLQHVGAQ
jgi:hypothetical protein